MILPSRNDDQWLAKNCFQIRFYRYQCTFGKYWHNSATNVKREITIVSSADCCDDSIFKHRIFYWFLWFLIISYKWSYFLVVFITFIWQVRIKKWVKMAIIHCAYKKYIIKIKNIQKYKKIFKTIKLFTFYKKFKQFL